jgi:hypothetical protein
MSKAAHARSGRMGAIPFANTLAGVWTAAAVAAVPLGILALALFLRTWRFELHGWTPDTYEQLDATKRLLAGDSPLSRLYPPGIAITMAPALLILPATLASMQAVIIGASLALIAVSYVLVLKATGDRVAATLLAAAIAIAPAFVYFSRDALFDVVGTAWIISAIALVPALRGRGLWAFVAYGAMLSIAVNVRATNAAFLPALLIYWSDIGAGEVRPRALLASLIRRELFVAGGVLVGLSALYAYIGGWTGNASGAPLTFAAFGKHLQHYAAAEFGYWGAFVLVPLAIAGGMDLWRRNRALLFVAVYMLAVWPLAHAPLPFASGRYMLPPLVFALLLAAHGPAQLGRISAQWSSAGRLAVHGAMVTGIAALGFVWCGLDAGMLYHWPSLAGQSDEAAYRELRPVIAALPPGALLVSTGTRGVRDSNRAIDYLDLIDYSIVAGNTSARVQGVLDRVTRARGEGRAVYYLRTRLEANGDNLGTGGAGFDRYFDALSGTTRMTESHRTSVPDFVLYRVE